MNLYFDILQLKSVEQDRVPIATVNDTSKVERGETVSAVSISVEFVAAQQYSQRPASDETILVIFDPRFKPVVNIAHRVLVLALSNGHIELSQHQLIKLKRVGAYPVANGMWYVFEMKFEEVFEFSSGFLLTCRVDESDEIVVESLRCKATY